MKEVIVHEIMVPLIEYATVSETATMFEAVAALEHSREKFDPKKHMHRAILVTDSNKRVVGKIGYMDFIQGLEPKYSETEELLQAIRGSSEFAAAFLPESLKSQMQKHALWTNPLNDLCSKVAKSHVKDFMYVLRDIDFIDINSSLDLAAHQLVLTRAQSLLVKKGDDVVGILRLSDVVETIFGLIKTCKI